MDSTQVVEPPTRKKASRRQRHWIEYATLVIQALGLLGLGIYAALTWGIFQQNRKTVIEMQRQTRIEERPWIKTGTPQEFLVAKGKPITFVAGNPLQVPIAFVNYGKTAARKVTTGITIDIFPMGDEPTFPDAAQTMVLGANNEAVATPPGKHVITVYPTEITGTGTIDPGENIMVTVSRVKLSSGRAQIDPLSQDDALRLNTGKSYVVVWGEVQYSDIFGTQHETRFCQAIPREATQKKCATFNEVDSEDGTNTN